MRMASLSRPFYVSFYAHKLPEPSHIGRVPLILTSDSKMANFVRSRSRCLLICLPLFTILSLTRSASVVDGAKRDESFVIDDHPTMRYVLQEVQDLRSTIIDLGEKLNAQEEKLISLLRSGSSSGTKADNSATVDSIPEQVIHALEKRISDKLEEKISAEVQSQLAALKKSKTQSTRLSSQVIEQEELLPASSDGGHHYLYTQLSNDLYRNLNKTVGGIVQENLKSFNRSVLKTVDAKDNHLLRRLYTIERSNPARTCKELVDSDPTLGSGFYYIDPDGLRVGDPPIRVRCEKSGDTIVTHDTMAKTSVKQCPQAGCYSRNVTYSDVTMRQMRALILLSSNCSQHIRYDCTGAPLRFTGIDYAWWNDREGKARYYWTDNSTENAHTCSCGLAENCIDTNVKCNCDASVGGALFDEGSVTNKDHLPVTRLNFGRLLSSISKGEHTLGPLRCSGASRGNNERPTSCADLWRSGQLYTGLHHVELENGTVVMLRCDMSKLPDDTGFETLIGHIDVKHADITTQYSSMVPRSCADLRRAGQTVSGLYQVQTNDADGKTISTVFCDMDKAIGSTGFETYIGINDVKSSLVHFSVARTSDYVKNGTVIPYEHVTLNLGNAMNIDSGVFTAPKRGIYSFTFHFAQLYKGKKIVIFCIRFNGMCDDPTHAASGILEDRNTGSVHIVTYLGVGDEVDTYQLEFSDGTLFSDNYKIVRFSGSLLFEML